MPFPAGRSALRSLCAVAFLAFAAGAPAAENPDEGAINLDQAIQALKDEVVQLNRDGQVSEEDYLYPEATRLTVYVSNRIPGLLLNTLSVTVDDGAAVKYDYTDADARALTAKNSLQRLLRANVTRGAHRLRASFSAHMANAKEGAEPITGTYEALFDKTLDPAEIELQVVRGHRAASMELKEWRAVE